LDAADHYLVALIDASRNAERAFEAAFADEYSAYPEDVRFTWAAAAVIHCDVLRHLEVYERATRDGLVRLLWLGDVICVLFEARKWYQHTGNPTLRVIAERNGYGRETVQQRLKKMNSSFPLDGVEAYENYRNRAGHHYDRGFIREIRTLSSMEAAHFNELLMYYVAFAYEWTRLCQEVMRHRHGPKA
jgi:hypothetical protein